MCKKCAFFSMFCLPFEVCNSYRVASVFKGPQRFLIRSSGFGDELLLLQVLVSCPPEHLPSEALPKPSVFSIVARKNKDLGEVILHVFNSRMLFS